MKKLVNIEGVVALSKNAQKSIHGGYFNPNNCAHYTCVVAVNPITGLCFCAED